MRRREFITLLVAAVGCPSAGLGQQDDRLRRIGVLMGWTESDPGAQARLKVFHEVLQELGWTLGSNLRIEYRWVAGDAARIPELAKELVALQPDLIVANTTPVTRTLHRETKTIPIVFVIVSDPVGEGVVASLARPGGNVTGFIDYEDTMGGKWLQLLKELARGIRRAALMYNPQAAPGGGGYFWPSFEAAARTMAIEPVQAPVRNADEIDAIVSALGRNPPGGIVTGTDRFLFIHRAIIFSSAAQEGASCVHGPRFCRKRRGGFIWTRPS